MLFSQTPFALESFTLWEADSRGDDVVVSGVSACTVSQDSSEVSSTCPVVVVTPFVAAIVSAGGFMVCKGPVGVLESVVIVVVGVSLHLWGPVWQTSCVGFSGSPS